MWPGVRRVRVVAARWLRGVGSMCLLAAGVDGSAAGFAAAETVTVEPVQDASLFEDAEGDVASGSGPVVFAGNNRTLITRRGVLLFDVSAAIPPGALIDAVELRLWVESAPLPDTTAVAVHRVTAHWGEGASASPGGAGTEAESGDATWRHRFYPDSLWSAPGGDFEPQALAVAEVGPEGAHTWSGPGLTADVQRWLNEPPENHGWLLQGDETGPQTVRAFHSREAESAALRPALVVTYTPRDVSVNRTNWGALKRLRPHGF